ncbi:hypothetical protein Celaphus_00016675 [Cervus elaphus hippelaphus]|uniref:Uncharacterized protein n=1 Tax=Cervus elaphus hippelaphus TaxID=46360 RepID=A0A212C413_CEREH|nr:hypothetical protein Celaphus_00016675 [Cervus elaphus hippelaphus]
MSCTGGTVPVTPMEGLSGRSCSQGHLCPVGLTEAAPCPPGFYASGTHPTKCHVCPSGHYCAPGLRPQLCPRAQLTEQRIQSEREEGEAATTGLSSPPAPPDEGRAVYSDYKAAGAHPLPSLSQVSPLPASLGLGFYCPEGTELSWQPCPAGTYGPVPGLSSLQACRACDGGRFCPRANATEAGGQCWEGFFCSRGSTRPNPEAGTEGYYCDSSAGPVQDFSLHPCPEGYYCPPGTFVATQHSCPVGTYGPRKGLRSITECQPCPAGKFCALAGLMAPSGDCAAGHWCVGGATSKDPTHGARGLLCPAGHYCLQAALHYPRSPGLHYPRSPGPTTLERPGCQLQQPSLLIGSHLGQLPAPTPSHPGGRSLGTWPIGSQGRREDTAERLQKRENTTALASAGRSTKTSAARVKRVVLQGPLFSPRLTVPYP